MKQQDAEYKRTYYHSFDKKYDNIPIIPLELIPKSWLSAGEFAQKNGISVQRVHQLFRMGLIRGVKANDPFYRKVRIFLDPESHPPKLTSWSRKKAIQKLGL